jgi:hypothetical protein
MKPEISTTPKPWDKFDEDLTGNDVSLVPKDEEDRINEALGKPAANNWSRGHNGKTTPTMMALAMAFAAVGAGFAPAVTARREYGGNEEAQFDRIKAAEDKRERRRAKAKLRESKLGGK